jgi:small GTP-binding protein
MTDIELVLGGDSLRVPRRVLMSCGLFEQDPTLLMRPYEVRSRVSADALRAFLEAVQGSEIEFTADLIADITALSSEFKYDFQNPQKLFPSIGTKCDSPILESETQRRIMVLEEQIVHYGRQLAVQQRKTAGITEVDKAIASLMDNFSRHSSEIIHLRAEVDSLKVGFASGMLALREELFAEIGRIRAPPSHSAAQPSRNDNHDSSFLRKRANTDSVRRSTDLPKSIAPAGRIDLGKPAVDLLLLGDQEVGKSVLRQCFSTGDRPNWKIASSTGFDCGSSFLSVRGKKIKVHLWDNPGEERCRSAVLSYAHHAHGLLVVYRTDLRKSFDSLPLWLDQLRNAGAPETPALIIAWDTKLNPAVVSTSQGQGLAKSLNAFFVELYAKQSIIQSGIVDFLEAASS